MILKELTFDLPFVPDESEIWKIAKAQNIGYSEAVKQYYSTNWVWKRRQFENDNACMCDMVMRLLPKKIITSDFWKINIACFDGNVYEKGSDRCGGVADIPFVIDHEHFTGLNDIQKKKWTIGTLTNAVSHADFLTTEQINAILDACERVRQQNYNNTFIGKRKHRKGGFAQLRIIYEVGFCEVYVDYLNNKYETESTELLAHIPPDRWVVSETVG